MATAPRVTRTAPGVLNPASATDAAVEREAQRQRDVRALLIRPLYREPTRAELAAISVDAEFRKSFDDLLAMPGTGITALLPDIGCESMRTVSASPGCLLRTMPGTGSSFSFRKKNYTMHRFADLYLSEGTISVTGEFSQGAVAELGDRGISSVTLEDQHIRGLSSLPYARHTADLGRPITGPYFRTFVPKEGFTYAIRSIAYRGELKRTVRGVAYNELKYDRRADITAVFRVVKVMANGTVIIVWHILSDTQSPELKK